MPRKVTDSPRAFAGADQAEGPFRLGLFFLQVVFDEIPSGYWFSGVY